MCVHRAWILVNKLPQRLDARILKVNMLHIIQYVSLPYWSYVERQLCGDKVSLDIDDLNKDDPLVLRGNRHKCSNYWTPVITYECLLPMC